MSAGMSRRDLILACVLVVSTFTLVYKLFTPVSLVISINGATISSENLPKFFTYSDIIVIVISTILVGFSIGHLTHPGATEKSAGETILEERKRRWEEVAKMLKEDEARVYKIIIESGGIIRQSEIVEKTGLSKASVSRILDLLESRGLIERRRRGMGNIVLLK